MTALEVKTRLETSLTVEGATAEDEGLLRALMPGHAMAGGCILAISAITALGPSIGYGRWGASNRAIRHRRSFHFMPQTKIKREVRSFARKGLSTRRVSFADRSVR